MPHEAFSDRHGLRNAEPLIYDRAPDSKGGGMEAAGRAQGERQLTPIVRDAVNSTRGYRNMARPERAECRSGEVPACSVFVLPSDPRFQAQIHKIPQATQMAEIPAVSHSCLVACGRQPFLPHEQYKL